ncbi:MAG: hypothetical protein EZS28_019773 [Streblomastix strix]|uniref:U-box domain-containing protein n=1 Tax=Streblomastix strix TaxID=222440 RepID=A0A5J4VQE7_9EUKA|nr:MAG: hypothetical protein EZS28_019773 [Streblomastix strix]
MAIPMEQYFLKPELHMNKFGDGFCHVIRSKQEIGRNFNREEDMYEVEFDEQTDHNKPVILYAEYGSNKDIDELIMGLGREQRIRVCVQFSEPGDCYWFRFVGIVRNDSDIDEYTKPVIPKNAPWANLFNIQPKTQPDNHPKTQQQTQPKTKPDNHPKTQPDIQPKTQPDNHPKTQPDIPIQTPKTPDSQQPSTKQQQQYPQLIKPTNIKPQQSANSSNILYSPVILQSPTPALVSDEVKRLEDSHIICPLDKKTMTRPVQTPDGNIYNYNSLNRYIQYNKGLGPQSKYIDMNNIVFRDDLIQQIVNFVRQNPNHPCVRLSSIEDWKRQGIM